MTALVVLGLRASTAFADVSGFNSLIDWTYKQADSGSPAGIPNANTVRLTNAGSFESRAVWYNTPQTFANFLVSFTYQSQGAAGCGSNDFGVAFVLHNNVNGLNAVAPSGGGDGYGYYLITNSAAVTLQARSNASGYFTNGSFGGGGANPVAPVTLLSGHPINVTLSYNGSILTQTLVDSVTSASFSTNYIATNMTAALGGGSTAYVGITGSTTCNTGTDQYLSNFQYTSVPEPSGLALLGIMGLAVRRRRIG